jgi:hypothetical protein
VRVRIQPVGLRAHQPTVVAVVAHVVVLRLVFLMRACYLQLCAPTLPRTKATERLPLLPAGCA